MAALIADSIFSQLVAILVLASILGFIAVKCKQPLIVAFIITGLLSGSDALNIVREEDKEVIETLAQFGIALLLFMVGLKLDLRIIKQTGATALIAGIIQVAATFALGVFISLSLGLGLAESAFIGLALSFSSTIIAVKLLSDKRAIDSFYGRITLGILIVQDLLVILTTIFIAAITGVGEDQAFQLHDFIEVLLKAVTLIILTGLFIKFVAKPITHMLARNTELMVTFCISFAVLMAAVCDTFFFHLSRELGGLVAGIALASTPYNNIIAARLSTLRDFMLLFFFAHLGAHMHLSGIGNHMVPALILSAFVLFGKPLIIMAITNLLRLKKRTGFFAGVTLAQISEFSLILVAMGVGAGMLDEETLNLITLVGLITMGVSTYGIVYCGNLYAFFENKTFLFQHSKKNYKEEDRHHELEEDYDVVIFGLGRYGEGMARLFKKHGYKVLGVDFDPEALHKAQEEGTTAVYGDAADPDFPSLLRLKKTKIIVFSFHHYLTGPLITDLRRTLAKSLREHGYKGHIAATSHHPEHDKDLQKHGIDVVLSPFKDAAFHATEHMIGLLKKNKALSEV